MAVTIITSEWPGFPCRSFWLCIRIADRSKPLNTRPLQSCNQKVKIHIVFNTSVLNLCYKPNRSYSKCVQYHHSISLRKVAILFSMSGEGWYSATKHNTADSFSSRFCVEVNPLTYQGLKTNWTPRSFCMTRLAVARTTNQHILTCQALQAVLAYVAYSRTVLFLNFDNPPRNFE